MAATITVGKKNHENLIWFANAYAVEFSYGNFYDFMERMGIEAQTKEGTVGDHPIGDFLDKINSRQLGIHRDKADRLKKLIATGITEGATHIFWA